MSVLVIVNNTARIIGLAPTPTFPNGVRLIPGDNNVPQKYMDELLAHEVECEAANSRTKLPNRFPGRELLEQLKEPVKIVTDRGISVGPQITVLTREQAGEEGPPPPVDLPGSVDVAIKMIELTNDKAALKRWSKDKRASVAARAAEKLAQ